MLELIGPSTSRTKTTVRLSIVLTNQLLTVELPMLEIIQHKRVSLCRAG